MKSHQRFPNPRWRNYEPEKRELRTGTSSTAVLSKNWEDGRMNAEDTQCSTQGVRFAVQCRGVVRHPVSVGKHAIHIDYAHVRRRE